MSVKINFDDLPPQYQTLFKADGCEKIPGKMRSPWHDKEEADRSYRDLCMNVWMNPTGAADIYFDPEVSQQVRERFIRNPKYEGELTFEVINKRSTTGVFKVGGLRNLLWYVPLVNDRISGMIRPDQDHNYIVGCDIGFGAGASNSTALIFDVNTGEQVGEYVVCDLSPEEFADAVAALVKWVGGQTDEAYLIWERNGGGGGLFARRIIAQGLIFIYTDTIEDTKSRTRKKRYGWTSTPGLEGTKNLVLSSLQAAIRESLKADRQHQFVIIYSRDLLDELDKYIFYPTGEASSGEQVDLTSGARARHGDRVIGLALCILAVLEQPKAKEALITNIPYGSLAWLRNQRNQAEANAKTDWREPKRRV